MLAWRLCREPFADLTGEGARRYGGRWNSPGRPLVYAASSAALAVLEIRVHLDLPFDLLPDDYVLVTIDLADAPTHTLTTIPPDPRAAGDIWLARQQTPILQVPSLIVPESANLLVNPTHPAAKTIAIRTLRRFGFDPRLWITPGVNPLPK